jgi:NAD(P)-dependent dehydrogenase (short-subunit alcohol dehydrogenase family)
MVLMLTLLAESWSSLFLTIRQGHDGWPHRLEKGLAATRELSAATGRKCFFTQVDVRKPDTLKEAVNKCITEFGRIDYVIAGTSPPPFGGALFLSLRMLRIPCSILGAAGNFLAPISRISENAFKAVIDIDIVRLCTPFSIFCITNNTLSARELQHIEGDAPLYSRDSWFRASSQL